ncbi:MAG TPA: HEPN domain-containing protein [Thermomicrobiales bacterium]|nr:HEPN domain-containing protein [Thermomicrobiales bacterium]
MNQDAIVFLAKASENLLAAESEFVNGRYNSCANRCYYACFQAAIAALLRDGIRPRGHWDHAFVQAQFVGLLLNRRKRYDPTLRPTLADNQSLRDKADYRADFVTQSEANGALRRCRRFVEEVQQRGEIIQ